MALFDATNHIWLQFLNIFPPQYHTLITSIIMLAIAFGLYGIFLINPALSGATFVVTLPILIPIVANFLTEAIKFLTDLLNSLPKPPVTPIMP